MKYIRAPRTGGRRGGLLSRFWSPGGTARSILNGATCVERGNFKSQSFWFLPHILVTDEIEFERSAYYIPLWRLLERWGNIYPASTSYLNALYLNKVEAVNVSNKQHFLKLSNLRWNLFHSHRVRNFRCFPREEQFSRCVITVHASRAQVNDSRWAEPITFSGKARTQRSLAPPLVANSRFNCTVIILLLLLLVWWSAYRRNVSLKRFVFGPRNFFCAKIGFLGLKSVALLLVGFDGRSSVKNRWHEYLQIIKQQLLNVV